MIFTIPGEPQGKARHRTTKTGRTYTPAKTVEYENLIRQCFLATNEQERLEGQITANIQAFFSIPKSASKKQREQMLMGDIRPTKKPDADNVAKSILDACNKIAYSDDSQVVKLLVEKHYGETPRVVVELIGERKKVTADG